MIKFKLILTMLFLITTIKPECGEGCLKCDDKRNKCIFCDPKEHYKTIRGKCIKSKNQNCAISSHDGNCLHCKEKFFLDIYTFKCVEIPKEGTVANCSEYSGNNRCSKCSDGFFLNRENDCVEISSPISNCEIYKSDNECVLCETGYLLGVDYKGCEKPSELENCGTYTQLKCVSCESGYIKNENNFIYQLLGFYNKRNIRNLEQEFILETGINLSTCRADTCQKLYVENCLIYSSFDECLTCSPGYFILEGTCHEYPEEKIPFCVTYSSLQTCTSCEKNMYLKSETECVPVEDTAPNCSEYDTSASATSCTKCFSTHFLSEPNICTKRSTESDITNCAELFIDQEKCQICSEDYVATNDKKACLAIVKNCQIYVSNDVTTPELVCNTCIEGYYYDSNTKLCVQGGKEFCKVYEKDANECATCENRYYLEAGTCNPHEDLVYCEGYNNILKDSCLVCNDKTQRFERTNTCLRVEEIPFCDVYASTTSCDVCNDGYFKTNQGICEIIPGEEFCLQKNGANCVKCLQNYILQSGSCKEPLFHLMKNCDSHTVNGTNSFSDLKCNYCRENTIPVDYKESYVCYEEDYIETQLGVTLVPNCLKYKKEGVYKCVSCDKDTVLENGACVAECSVNNTLRSHVIQYFKSEGSSNFDNIYIEKSKECGQKVPNCKEASPDLLQDFNNFLYSCVICEEGTISEVKFDQRRVLIRPPSENNDNTDFSPLSYSPSKDCIPIADDSTKIIGDLSNGRTSVPFCDLYYDLDIAYGCLKCMRGYTGEVVDIIYQCELYENLTTCKKCYQGYYLLKNYLCVKNTPVLNCVEYGSGFGEDVCKLCKEGFFLNGPSECKLRDSLVVDCKVYNFDDQNCQECYPGYIASTNFCVKQLVRCLPDFHNVTPDADVNNPPTVVCDKCIIGYYRFNDKCMPGTISDCLEYELDVVNTCKLCDSGKYLKDNSCTDQSAMTNCSVKSQIQGYCHTCDDKYFLFENKKECTVISTITNCVEYSSPTLCKKCAQNNYLSAKGKKCLTMPLAWNCLEWSEFPNEECVECLANYVLYEGTCHYWFAVQMEYCDSGIDVVNNAKLNHKTCKYCKDDATDVFQGFDLNSLGMCMENIFFDYLKKKKNGQNALNLRIPDNCDRYEYLAAGVIICKKCSTNYFVLLETTPVDHTVCISLETCIAKADHYPAYTNLELFNTDLVKVKFGPSCIELTGNDYAGPIDITNCYVSPILNSSTTIIYRCTRCLKGYISIIDLTKSNANRSIGFYDGEIFGNETYSFNHSAPVIDKCVKAIELNVSGSNLDSYNELRGCKFYYEYKTDNYGCFACQFGYTGALFPEETNTHGYINTCHEDQVTCHAGNTSELRNMRSLYHPDLFEHSLNGFDFGIFFTSCQVCVDGSIPTVKFSANDSGDAYLGITGLTNGGPTPAVLGPAPLSATPILLNECSVVTAETDIIANCAYAFQNIPVSTSTAGTQPETGYSFFCVACAPGYRPVPTELAGGGNIGIVGECVLIDNCDLTTNTALGDNIINGCSTCSSTADKTYTWLYDETKKRIKTDTCSETTTPNCLAVTSSMVCKICKDGFSLLDEKCVQQIPHLEANSLKQDVTNAISVNDLQTLFFFHSNPVGIDKCSGVAHSPIINYNGLFANAEINIPEIDMICSKFVDSAVATPDMTIHVNTAANNLVDNCQVVSYTSYKFNLLKSNRVDCVLCEIDYIRSDDGKCVLQADFANCVLAVGLNSSFCKECAADYVAVAGICLVFNKSTPTATARPVEHCEEFDEVAFATSIVCNKCYDGKMMQTSTVDGKVTYSCIDPETPIDNCAQYNSEDENNIYCKECDHNYALMILDEDTVNLPNPTPGFNRICLPISSISDTNCTSYNKAKLAVGKLECETCASTHILTEKSDILNTCAPIPIVSNCDTYDLVTTLVDSVTDINYNAELSTFACSSCSTGFYLKQETGSNYTCETRTNVTSYLGNCSVFEKYSDSCKSCLPNFVLNLENNTCDPAVTTTKLGSILNCSKMDSCNVEVKYDGLHPHLESITSCHQCKNPSQIPFIAIVGDASFTKIDGIGKYGIDDSAEYKAKDKGRSVFCEEPLNTNFGITTPADFTFPTNCAIGVLNVNSAKDSSNSIFHSSPIDRTKVAVFCGACKPGFKAVYGNDNNGTPVIVDFVITDCVVINNCAQKNSFNSCSKCAVGYSFEFVDNKVMFDSCVADDGNLACYAYDDANSKCKLCNKGTYLNKDGICESINPPRCEFDHFNFKNNYDLKTFNAGLFLNNEGTGCNKCIQGYKSIFEPNHYFICTESEIHSKGNLPANSSQYLENCKNYHVVNNLLRCVTCHTDYVPLNLTGVCIGMVDTPDCALALTNTSCVTCVDTHIAVNRKCELKAIENCDEYLYDMNNATQKCKECDEGFYITATNTCDKGDVKNCLIFETKTVCNQCKENFQLVTRSEGISYCFPIDQRLNCKQFVRNQFQTGTLECAECKNNLFVKNYDQGNFFKTHCMKFSEVPNCVKYNINPENADSSFACEKCTPNFFLSNTSTCILRTIKPEKCTEYNSTEDKCLRCEEGYYLAEGSQCKVFPTGVPYCRIYENTTKCTSCITNRYLSENNCLPVTEENQVENCLYYVTNRICEVCAPNHDLREGTCVPIQALNCLTLETVTTCLSCPDTFGFKEENGIKSCVQLSIPNCLKVEDEEPNHCITCDSLNYVLDGVCTPFEKEIIGCVEYESATTCRKCNSSTALALDQTVCVSNSRVALDIDMNCEETKVIEKAVCNTCLNGYVFVNGVCTKCETDEERCYSCDPKRLDVCLMCKSGYFMNVDLGCMHVSEIPKEEGEGDGKGDGKGDVVDPNEGKEEPKEEFILRLLVKMIIMFYYLF